MLESARDSLEWSVWDNGTKNCRWGLSFAKLVEGDESFEREQGKFMPSILEAEKRIPIDLTAMLGQTQLSCVFRLMSAHLGVINLFRSYSQMGLDICFSCNQAFATLKYWFWIRYTKNGWS